MPDVWTTNREHLRNAIIGLGGECGVEARVIKPRDPEWTCHADSGGYIRDIYIHSHFDYYKTPPVLNGFILFFGLGVLIGLVWGKKFWRPNASRNRLQ